MNISLCCVIIFYGMQAGALKTPKFQAENSTIFVGHSSGIFESSNPRPGFDKAQFNFGKKHGQNDIRTKRGVFHLYNMVSCATGCNPLIYKGYGCFCGFLGSGNPMDGIDRCCKMHDRCYEATDCPKFLVYLIPYYWQCVHDKPLCAIDHGDLGAPNSCADKLCQCDRKLSECLSRFRCPEERAVCTSVPFRLIQNILMVYP